MDDPSRNPVVDLSQKILLPESRVRNDESAPHRALRCPKGTIAPGTADLDVPIMTVIDHSRLAPLSGKMPPVNQAGNPTHNPRTPIYFWYQDTPVGKEVNVVLYTDRCEWGRCSFCTLPSESSPTPVTRHDLHLQLIFVIDSLTPHQRQSVRRLFISNNGSILNPHTMPPASLVEAVELAHEHFPELSIICFETRFETVHPNVIRGLQHWCQQYHDQHTQTGKRTAPSPALLQISGGYETQDPYLRNGILWKQYPEHAVQEMFREMAALRDDVGAEVLLDEYVMLKPAAGMSDEDAISEAVQTILHLERLGNKADVRVSVRLNPTFAAVGSELYLQFKEENYSPPTYRDVFEVLRRCDLEDVGIPVFLGLNNEGLAYDDGSFGNRDATDPYYYRTLRDYNAHQDFRRLAAEVEIIEERLRDTEEGRLVLKLQQLGIRINQLSDRPVEGIASAIDQLHESGLPISAVMEHIEHAASALEKCNIDIDPSAAQKVSRT